MTRQLYRKRAGQTKRQVAYVSRP